MKRKWRGTQYRCVLLSNSVEQCG
uniref:Uncharacterized protein n=1 Tax=Anguilla anguilla TaxID=7936 RepID=A0A0E9UMQ4_ANGAN